MVPKHADRNLVQRDSNMLLYNFTIDAACPSHDSSLTKSRFSSDLVFRDTGPPRFDNDDLCKAGQSGSRT